MVVYVLSVVALLAVIVLLAGWMLSEPGHQGEKSTHFDGEKFYNSNGKSAKGFKDVFKYLATGKKGPWEKNYENGQFEGSLTSQATEEVQVIFVNHSTFLIQMDGVNILTDPIWSHRCSPFSFMGPERMRPPGLSFEDLPKIDMVLISHNHYDHLDVPTLENLITRDQPTFILPLGIQKMNIFKNQSVQVFDWYDRAQIENLRITATPAVHFSSRGMFDRDKTLWCGYIIEGSKKLYFVGDTAYDEVMFKELGEKHPDIDLAFIPIGAYKPNWFMSSVHVDPKEAVEIFHDIKTPQSIAMHFGTFALADEGQGEAEKDLQRELAQKGISNGRFMIPEEGALYRF